MDTKPSPAPFAPWTDPAAVPLIRFEGVTKRFGDFTALQGIDLQIYPREFFALLGPSGCGKTTLMRMLAGFETPTEGTIWLDGQNIAPVPPNKRPVNMMFQSYALFPHLSVWDNIAFGLRRAGQDKDTIKARVEEMLRLTRLDQFARRKPHQISGGQRQRVALARSLALGPKLLLLDEPLGALDKKLRQDTQFELMDIQEKTGTTFVIVTHDQEEAMTVASRVAVMDAGRLCQIDTPQHIYETPNSRYVADFIGEVSIIEGRVDSLGEEIGIAYAEGQKPVMTRTGGTEVALGQSVFYAIRPEKIWVGAEPHPDRINSVEGTIVDIGYLGDVSTYHVRLDSGQMIKALMTNAERYAASRFTWNDRVWLSWSRHAGVVLTS
ncbi:ABC transporter ATP-binding protein [Mangrovicoccus ximenensis]|uniref:ABC transporter ATP-binding protein n=1 Tax=Mangrovicoccus ximenensis TaxID=1911570 RepID=UPI000D3A1889|nr:ABC transporter ATP-binding protein [Mangrovicoccus ximenensis]